MAFNSFLRRASSSIILLPVIRSIETPRQYQSVISHPNVENRSRIGDQFPPSVQFQSYRSGRTTKKASELETSEITFPDNFPFSLIDRYYNRYVTLKRKFEDEIIKINVTTYKNVTDYYKDDDRSMADDEFYDYKRVPVLPDHDVAHVNQCLRMEVEIFYDDVYKRRLEFDVLAFIDHTPRIFIRRMSMSVSPNCTDEFSRLHLEDFEDFLKTRGITDSNINPLFNYLEGRNFFDIGRPYRKLRELVRVVTNRGQFKMDDNHFLFYGFDPFFLIVFYPLFLLFFTIVVLIYNILQELDRVLVTTEQIEISNDNHVSPRF